MINIKMKSCSASFANWIKEVDEILSQTQRTSTSGEPLEYVDEHFQNQCSMNFEDAPIYPINEQIAVDLLWSHLEGKDERRTQ
jgi:hypothetical protein